MEEYIWYVSYGSNLCYERFLCYITGNESQRYKVKRTKGCSNKNPPKESKAINLPYQLVFAKHSSRWQNGGVCFLDISKCNKTYARAYLITKEQFLTIQEQEGNWYSKIVELEPIDGYKSYTFTYDGIPTPKCLPSKEYLRVIIDGLVECGLSKDKAQEYISNVLKV